MAIAIAVLIAIALCYILKEKCSKKQAYREQSWRYKEEFARHALADSLSEIEFPAYTLYPQYSPDGKEYYYNFHRFSYLRDSFKLPPKDYPVNDKDIYINAWKSSSGNKANLEEQCSRPANCVTVTGNMIMYVDSVQCVFRCI